MSIPVSPAQMDEVLARFESASLITKSSPHVKILTVDPAMDDGTLFIENVTGSTLANVAADPHVTLIWQQHVHHGWTLIVDGTAHVEGDRLRISMDSGMLHRPRAHADGPGWDL
ncbi:pyridoxamine 5'-phosphate oxidase family protein [Actinomycetaceae bacterium L2_0104]